MTRYFVKRLAGAIPTLFVIITAAFFLIRAAPGGPFDQEQRLPPEIRANLESAYGLDLPIWAQYGRYLEALAHGDFGPSFKYKDFSVTELIAQGFPVTLELGFIALLLALGLGIPIGTFAALRHNTAADYATMTFAVIGIAVPSFVVLPFLGLLFGIHLHWLPVAGWEPGSLRHLVLPVIALCLPPLAYIARMTRGSMLELLRSPFIRTAFAKGLPLSLVITRHALRPAMMPVAGYLAPAVAAIMTGSLVVETIAGLPGIGRYLVQGALNRDYTLVMGMVNLLYAWLDPRIRFGH
jgi:oligopeptide transport system permease protein